MAHAQAPGGAPFSDAYHGRIPLCVGQELPSYQDVEQNSTFCSMLRHRQCRAFAHGSGCFPKRSIVHRGLYSQVRHLGVAALAQLESRRPRQPVRSLAGRLPRAIARGWFSRPRLINQADNVTFVDFQVDGMERYNVAESFGSALYREQRRWHRTFNSLCPTQPPSSGRDVLSRFCSHAGVLSASVPEFPFERPPCQSC